MRTELYSALGFYTPSFFKIQIATDRRIGDIREMSEEVAAAFFHEYVHYMQDMMTTYGLMNINYVVDFIKSVNVNQLASAERELPIPYQLTEQKDNLTYFNSALQKIYMGTTKSVQASSITGYTMEKVAVRVPGGGNTLLDREVEQFTLRGLDRENERFEYQFGSDAVMESMAYEMEQMLYPGMLEDPSGFPYRAARYFADHMIPEFSRDPLRIIALCDVAMMDFHPARTFHACLRAIIDHQIDYSDPNALHRDLFGRIHGSFNGFESSLEVFDYMSTSTAGQLSGYFTTDVFGQNKIWYDYLFTKAAIFRRSSSGIFLQLASGGPIATNTTFQTIYSQLGQPVTVNSQNHAVFAVRNIDPTNIRPEMTWVINQIYNIYINSRKSFNCRCNLIAWCQASCAHQGIEDYTDQRCWDSPWSRVEDEELCTFAQVWKSWGLQNEIPIVRWQQ